MKHLKRLKIVANMTVVGLRGVWYGRHIPADCLIFDYSVFSVAAPMPPLAVKTFTMKKNAVYDEYIELMERLALPRRAARQKGGGK